MSCNSLTKQLVSFWNNLVPVIKLTTIKEAKQLEISSLHNLLLMANDLPQEMLVAILIKDLQFGSNLEIVLQKYKFSDDIVDRKLIDYITSAALAGDLENFISFTKRLRTTNNNSMQFYYNYYEQHLLSKVTRPEDLFIPKELASIWLDALDTI